MSGPDPKASAAAMDALNLDDLFLGGDDDDAQGGMADSLFADMDLDLGDIMDGIIGDEASGGGGGGGASGSLSGDFDFGSSAGGFSRSSSRGSGGGGGRDSAPPAQDPSSSAASSSTIGKKGKSRTARSNPFLAMAQAKEKESQSKLKRESALAKEARELSLGNSDILSPTAKRKRRKSKKVMEEEDEYLPDSSSGGGVGSSILPNQPLKKSKRSIKRSSKLERESSTSSILSTNSILPQSHEAKIGHHQQQSSSMVSQGDDILTPKTSSDSATPKPPPTWEEVQKSRQLIVQQAQESMAKFGLAPSKTTFFPYMNHLPHEVDVKQQKGKKVYPMLEKLMAQSVVSQKSDGGGGGSEMIATTSPIYKLFDTHLGGLTDNHGNVHSPPALQASLLNSIQTASNMIKKQQKNKKNKDSSSNHHHHSHSHHQHQHLIEELTKLYLGTMKQSLFLRQNLWNMERWCEKNFKDFHKDDAKDPPLHKRKEVEWVLRMITKQREKDQQHEQKSNERKVKQYRNEQQLQKLQKEHKQKTKIFASDPKSLPMSEYLPNAPTHGGPKSNPVINVKVRVKVSGWRDKSGARLTARLWGPNGWKVALSRANNKYNMAPLPQSSLSETGGVASMPSLIPKSTLNATIGKLDFSSVDPVTMEAVASELVRYDLMPKKREETPAIEAKKESSAAVVAVTTAKGDAKSSAPVPSSSGPDTSKDDKTKKDDKKTSKSKKRKAKDKDASTTATSSSGASSTTAVVRSSGKRYKPFIPHIPSLDKSRYPPAILAPAATVSSISAAKSTTSTASSDSNDIHTQQQHLIQVLYNQILNPALSPTERRQLLANEISSTLTKLQTSHSTKHLNKNLAIQKQIEELQTIYEEDKEIVPENCNTIGLWNWMKHNNYFDKMDTVEDVYDGLEGIWQPELENGVDVNGDGWGTLPPVKVLDSSSKIVDTGEGKGVEGEHVALVAKDASGSINTREGIKSSPLFDRLQSLLVEENDEDDDEPNQEGEDDIDDDLLSSLPPYSPEEFIFGPNNKISKSSSCHASLDDDSTQDDGMLDVSALSLDQRTFIQLRAAGLVDKNTTPFFPRPPSTAFANGSIDNVSLLSPTTSTLLSTASSNSEDSIEAVLSKMKSKLSTVHIQNNANVATLQHKALSQIMASRGNTGTSKGSKQIDVDSILQKYKHLQKAQKQEKEEKLIRTSGRVKTGSNKFDSEQWLPW